MKKIIYEKVGARLKYARELRDVSLEKAGEAVGVHKSTILRWERGNTEKFKIPVLETLANLYSVNSAWLMGYDVPMEGNSQSINKDVMGEQVVSIPVLGTVKAGYDYLAQENWIGSVDVETCLVGDGKEYFALKVKGDSMSPVLIEDDIVIVKKQDDFENGDIVVAIINGDEATIKKGKKSEAGILLQPLNNTYEPLIFTNEEIKDIPVLVVGVVKQLKREF